MGRERPRPFFFSPWRYRVNHWIKLERKQRAVVSCEGLLTANVAPAAGRSSSRDKHQMRFRLIFEEAFLFQTGVLVKKRAADAERKPVVVQVDDRIRESARRARLTSPSFWKYRYHGTPSGGRKGR